MPLLSRKRVGFIITVFFVFLVFFGISAEAEEDGNAAAEKFVVPGGQSVGVSLDLSGVYVDGLGVLRPRAAPAPLRQSRPG